MKSKIPSFGKSILLAAALIAGNISANGSTNISPGNFNPVDTLIVGTNYTSYGWTSNATGSGGGSATVTLSWTSTAMFGSGSVSGTGGATKNFSVTPTNADLGLQSITITTSSTNGGTFAGGTKRFWVKAAFTCNLSASIASVTNVSCNGGNNGEVAVNLSGGTAPFSYNWSPSGSGNPATGLTAGSYTVTVTDANNCTATASATVSEPTALSASASTTADVKCYGGNDGSVSASATGGTPGYSYSWSPAGGTANTASGLTAGTYIVTVTDNNGCTATASTNVSQPTAIIAGASASPSTFYLGYSTSTTLSATATGGTPGYSYSWSPAGGTANPTSVSPTTAGTNTYTVTVTDANGCTQTASANVNVIDVRCYAGNSSEQKVLVCHKAGNKWNTLCVDKTAIASHLAHGDYLGSCTSGAKSSLMEENLASANEITIYPNPTSGNFTIELPANVKAEKVLVIDITGKTIVSKVDVEGKVNIDMSNTANGIYIVEVQYGTEVYRSKVSIQ